MLRNLWHRWLGFAQKIGTFQSRVLLTLFYFLVVTPFGLAVRLFSDPLDRKRRPAQSAWKSRATRDVDLTAARRQS
ncbi:MAG: hypothetical protein NZ528_00065 [Caldilineales bacterium]|nr:hypothetical protein [Caldilineales bacterium]MDW8318255.1 hypothetical protein [Anaerolineae bacterium]